MLEFYVNNQTLTLYTPVVAADALHYLTGVVHFTDEEWDGYSKWLHFMRSVEGETPVIYDVALTNDAFSEEAELNLTAGEWTVYLTGDLDEARLTSVPVILTVKASGLLDVPLHGLPLSVAEQLDGKASTALALAQAVAAAAAAGEFNGADGRGYVISGFFETAEGLEEAVTDPEAGEAYGVGTTAPYDIYIWDAVHETWVNNGPIQGATGATGGTGTTFTPALDAAGNLSWTNDGGKTNPPTQNIRGPQGNAGEDGDNGMSPLAAATAYGYEGTEATLYTALAALPFHHSRHLPDGPDPITVKTGNLEAACVTRAKVADDAVTSLYTGTIGTTWVPSTVRVSTSISPDGVEASYQIPGTPSHVYEVMEVASGNVLRDGTDYTYSAGTLTFTSVPAEGTNAYIVFYPSEGAPYTQELSFPGLLETDRVLVDAVLPEAVGTAEETQMAFGYIYKIDVVDDGIKVYSMESAEVEIPIQLLAVSR